MTGCSYAWTREFILPKRSALPVVEGWSIEPEIVAYKNIGSRVEPTKDWYTFDMDVSFKRSKKNVALGELPLLEIDSVIVVFNDSLANEPCYLRSKVWVSHLSRDSLTRALSFQGYHVKATYDLLIPHHIDTLKIQFIAKITDGKHVIVEKYTVPSDSIAPGPLETARYYPMTITVVRHETKQKVPAFIINSD